MIFKKNENIKVRFIVGFAAWFTLAALYIHRSNISISILEMTVIKKSNDESICITNRTKTPDVNTTTNETSKFHWSDSLQATILGSFFYGYAATHFIGGLFSARFGPRLTIIISALGSSIFMFLSTELTKLSPYALIVCRIGSGLFSGPIYPIMHEIVGSWSPLQERTAMTLTVHTGNMAGSIINFAIGGFITQIGSEGWGIFFYVSGAIGLLAVIFALLAIFDGPFKHPYISENEIRHIKGISGDLNDKTEKSDHLSLKDIPFKEIFTSVPAWTTILAHFSSNFLLYTLLTGLPKFLSQVYGSSTVESSLFTVIPFLIVFIVNAVWPHLIDYLIVKKKYPVFQMRRMSAILGTVCASLLIAISGTLPCERKETAIILICISMGFYGINTSGYMTSMVEIAPRYAGVIMGLANTLGSVAGFVQPQVAAAFLEGRDKKEGWMYTFIVTGCVMFVFSLPFIIFGSSKLQPWAEKPKIRALDVELE